MFARGRKHSIKVVSTNSKSKGQKVLDPKGKSATVSGVWLILAFAVSGVLLIAFANKYLQQEKGKRDQAVLVEIEKEIKLADALLVWPQTPDGMKTATAHTKRALELAATTELPIAIKANLWVLDYELAMRHPTTEDSVRLFRHGNAILDEQRLSPVMRMKIGDLTLSKGSSLAHDQFEYICERLNGKLQNRGTTYMEPELTNDAERYMRDVIVRLPPGRKMSLSEANLLRDLGFVLAATGRAQEGRELLQRMRKMPGVTRQCRAVMGDGLSVCDLALEDFNTMNETVRESVSTQESFPSDQYRHKLYPVLLGATECQAQGWFAECDRLLDTTLAIKRERDASVLLLKKANLYTSFGKFSKAHDVIKRFKKYIASSPGIHALYVALSFRLAVSENRATDIAFWSGELKQFEHRDLNDGNINGALDNAQRLKIAAKQLEEITAQGQELTGASCRLEVAKLLGSCNPRSEALLLKNLDIIRAHPDDVKLAYHTLYPTLDALSLRYRQLHQPELLIATVEPWLPKLNRGGFYYGWVELSFRVAKAYLDVGNQDAAIKYSYQGFKKYCDPSWLGAVVIQGFIGELIKDNSEIAFALEKTHPKDSAKLISYLPSMCKIAVQDPLLISSELALANAMLDHSHYAEADTFYTDVEHYYLGRKQLPSYLQVRLQRCHRLKERGKIDQCQRLIEESLQQSSGIQDILLDSPRQALKALL